MMTAAKLDFDPIGLDDSRWFEKLVQRGNQINEIKQKEGKSFWILSTFDGKEYHVSLYADAEGATLYFSTGSVAAKMSIRKVKTLHKDHKAQSEWERLQDSTAKEDFAKRWYASSPDRYILSEAILQ